MPAALALLCLVTTQVLWLVCFVCGDGVLSPGEACDDGNGDDFDGCDTQCVSSCGNALVDPGELCFAPSSPQPFSLRALSAIEDQDGDGAQEIVGVSFDNTEVTVFSPSSGALSPISSSPLQGGSDILNRFLFVDINGDLRSDLIYCIGPSTDPTQPRPLEVLLLLGPLTPQSIVVQLPVASCPLDAADADGDQDVDLFLGPLSILHNEGAGFTAQSLLTAASPTTAKEVSRFFLADLNGDQVLDVAAEAQPQTPPASPTLFVFLLNGQGSIQSESSLLSNLSGPFLVADLDGSSSTDLMASDGLTLRAFVNDGAAFFQAQPISLPASLQPLAFLGVTELDGVPFTGPEFLWFDSSRSHLAVSRFFLSEGPILFLSMAERPTSFLRGRFGGSSFGDLLLFNDEAFLIEQVTLLLSTP